MVKTQPAKALTKVNELTMKQSLGVALMVMSVNFMILGMGTEITNFILGKFDQGIIWALIFVLCSLASFLFGIFYLLEPFKERFVPGPKFIPHP